jgi:chromosome segregation ATPase
LTRRWGPNDLEAARRVVSSAERQALDRAEQLRLEAEALLVASAERRAEEDRKVREEVTSEVDGLRAQLEEVTQRAADAEAELQRLQVEWERDGQPDPADDPARPALTLVTDEGASTDASYLADFVARMTAEAERLVDAAKAATATGPPAEPARTEADDLIKDALSAIERDTTAAASLVAEAEGERRAAEELRRQVERERQAIDELRRQVERERQAADELRRELEREHRAAAVAREEAQNQLSEARAQAERLLAEACASRDAQRRQLAAQMASLRDAMDVVRESLDRIISEGRPGREAIDLRELTDLGQRQRRF